VEAMGNAEDRVRRGMIPLGLAMTESSVFVASLLLQTVNEMFI
jgi:hypothetical protein